MEEAMEYYYSEQIEADILALPSEVDEFTDEQQFDDEDLGAPVVNDIPGGTEIDIIDNDDDFKEIAQDDNVDEDE